MIYYSPVTGDPRTEPVSWRPRTAFVMQQLGRPVPPAVRAVRRKIDTLLANSRFRTIDASDVTTGRDYLAKIWELLISCPVGVAIVHEDIAPMTMANIYYELGILDALGRESIVVAVGKPELPSDLTRTEHISTGRGFDRRFAGFITSLERRATYYHRMARNLDRNPLLTIDLLRRASMLNGDAALNRVARKVWFTLGTTHRAKGAVESLMITF